MERKRCGNCGATIPGSATFCPRCGVTLGGGGAAAGGPVRRLEFTPVGHGGGGSGAQPSRGAGALLVALLLLLCVGVIVLFVVPTRVKGPNVAQVSRVGIPSLPQARPARMVAPAPPLPPGRQPKWQPRAYRMTEFDEPTLPGGRAVVPLREPFDRYQVGGGGRYHLFHLPKSGTITVVDVSAAAVVKEISVGRDGVQFAAGRRYFVIYDPFRGGVQRWSFKKFECDRVEPLPSNQPLRELVMAPADDLAYLTYDDATYTLDVTEMRLTSDPPALPQLGQSLRGLRLSFDGQLGTVGDHIIGLAFGRRQSVGTAPRFGASNAGASQPSADGHLVFVGDRIFTPDGRRIESPAGAAAAGVYVPSADPRFFWVVSDTEATLVTTADRARVYTLKGLEPIALTGVQTPRFYHLPQAKTLVLVQPDHVVLRRFELTEALRKTGEPYLFVQSLPPERASRSFPYMYWLDTVSSAGGLHYRLVSGPKKMTVNEHAGFVQWTPDEDEDEGRVPVAVGVKDDSGREVVHRFDVEVTQ